MANEIKLTFAGDATSLTRSFDSVGAGAKEMADDLDTAGREAGRFSGAVEGMNGKIDSAEGKFMGAADLADGLSSALGLNIGPAIEMSRAFADMAGGFTALVGPALEGLTKKLGASTMATNIQTGAQRVLNAVMKGNPIFMVVGVLTLLAGAFVIAYKRSETFRAVVHKAMDGVKTAVGWVGDKFEWLWGKIKSGVDSAGRVLGRVTSIITTPYRLAFNGIASLWNNTVGRLSFTIPGWVPGIGGSGFDVPDIPTFAKGGVAQANRLAIVGEAGPELFVPGTTGTIIPNHSLGGQTVTVLFAPSGDPFLEAIRKTVRVKGGVGPNSVQMALGA